MVAVETNVVDRFFSIAHVTESLTSYAIRKSHLYQPPNQIGLMREEFQKRNERDGEQEQFTKRKDGMYSNKFNLQSDCTYSEVTLLK